MLFVKYISDVWKDRTAALMAQYNGNDARVKRQMRHERFVLPDGADYDTIYEKSQGREANIGEIINIALEQIEDGNKEKLEGVFRNIDFNSEANLGRIKQRNDRLENLLTDYSNKRLDFRPSRMGSLDIIGRFASDVGKKGGEFYTPPEVSLLLAELLDPNRANASVTWRADRGRCSSSALNASPIAITRCGRRKLMARRGRCRVPGRFG